MNFKFKKWEIKSSVWRKSRSWGHESRLFYDGLEENYARIKYQNRTWESFEFESCMLDVVTDWIENYRKKFEKSFKHTNNIKRLNPEKRVEMMVEFSQTKLTKNTCLHDAHELLEAIENYKPETDGRLNAMKGFLALGDLMTNKTESEANAVAYKERIVFATMRSMIPDWQEPKDWAQLSNSDKMTRLKKLEEVV